MKLEIPEKYAECLRVGTCSWKYDTWKGLLYDEGTKYHRDDYLVDYSKHLNTVEVDQWFWSLFPGALKLPDRDAVETCATSVPRDFVFTVKAPNSITLTHFYARQAKQHKDYANRPNDLFLSADLLKRFLKTLEPLRGRLGPVMFQFEYLNKKKMPSRDDFLARLGKFFDNAPVGYQYAVETRDAGIRSAVEIVKQNADKAITTYLNVNNHYEGSAPLTIERFLEALKKAG